MNSDSGTDPTVAFDIALLLSQATSADMLIDALNGMPFKRHYIKFSYLIGSTIVERWPTEWPCALDCLLGGLAHCTETFNHSLRNDDIEWAGCAACMILDRCATTSYNSADNKLLRNLASFSYYSLSYIIRSKKRCTVNALITRSVLMRGNAAHFIDGLLPGTPPHIPIMCAISDYHDALVKYRELGFETPLNSLTRHAPTTSIDIMRATSFPDIPVDMQNHAVEVGHFIHAHLYKTSGLSFEQGHYNIFSIANLKSIISGCSDK